ncbi:hypothetical protein OAF58_01380, partial [bacterium]|nr:hypothetical protein [bacterium]
MALSPSSMDRRRFLTRSSGSAACLLGNFSFLQGLQPITAADTLITPNMVRVGGEIEPVVRMLETTPRKRLLEHVGARVKSGQLNYQQI